MKNIKLAIIALAAMSVACNPQDEVFSNINTGEPIQQSTNLPDVSVLTGYNLTTAPAGWTQVWADNFDGTLANWTVWNGGAYNNEKQLYQRNNITLDGGHLFIKSKRENASGPTTNVDATPKNFTFTSGRLESIPVFGPSTQPTGKVRIAARVKLPGGDGLWPAFWTYNDPWPTKGEIDILEFRGNNRFTSVSNIFYGTQPGIPLTNSNTLTFNYQSPTDLTTGWRVYELIWSATAMEIYLDGTLINTFDASDSEYVDDFFSHDHRIILNLAIGGDFFNGLNLVDSNIPNEAYYIVDWVKVFREN